MKSWLRRTVHGHPPQNESGNPNQNCGSDQQRKPSPALFPDRPIPFRRGTGGSLQGFESESDVLRGL